MPEKFTVVEIDGAPGYAARGHISHAEAIETAEHHYREQLIIASAVLSAIRAGEFRVFHQTGLYRVHNRREVIADEGR